MARPYVSHPSQTHLESGNLDDDDKKHSFFQFLLNLRRAEEQQKEPTPGEMPQAATTTQTKMITFTQHNKKLLSKEIKIVQTRVVSGSEDDDHDIAISLKGIHSMRSITSLSMRLVGCTVPCYALIPAFCGAKRLNIW